MEHLAGLKLSDIKRVLKTHGVNRGVAPELWKSYYSSDSSVLDFSSFSHEIPDKVFSTSELETEAVSVSSDGVRKFLFRLRDGEKIEAVLIPEEKRMTACISSQVGCKFRCRFCVTGSGGFTRDLTAGEIVEQVLKIQWETGSRITNVVFMGMGEPFDNFEAVSGSIDIMSQVQGLAIAPRKITVSTVGHIPGIKKMAEGAFKASLAVSLHSPFNDERIRLMPGTSVFPVSDLVDTLEYYCKCTGKKVYFEYILLSGVNDSLEHAGALTDIMRRIPSKVNLIRYNYGADLKLKKTALEIEDAFYYYIINKGFNAVFRKSRGEDVNAACGQLASK